MSGQPAPPMAQKDRSLKGEPALQPVLRVIPRQPGAN